MTTKEQERKALEQIKKILAGLGENSYIGTAMDGMIEDAEENIENDFAMSWKDRAIGAQSENDSLRTMNERLQKQVKELEAKVSVREMEIESKESDLNLVITRKNEYHDSMIEEANARAEAEQKVAELENEIIKLKAKLYDLMTK